MESTMNRRPIRALLVFATALAAAGPAFGQTTPNFSKYVALGDSYGAGASANCVVERNQKFSYPATLAKQFGISGFQQPTVSEPGLPTCIGLKSLNPVTFGPISTKTGAPTNLALTRSYDNLSVPGFKIADVSDPAATGTGGAAALVLRGMGTALQQALGLNPTFITLGIIGEDILNAAGAGFLLDGVTATPLPLFTAKFNSTATALKASGRTGVFLGTPYLKFIPLAATIPPVVTDANGVPITVGGQTIPLLGPGNSKYPCPTGVTACPLPAGTLVTLGANAPQASLGGKSLLGVGFGIPCAVAPTLPQCGKPLPDGGFTPPATVNIGVLLYPDEVQAIDDRIKAMNEAIKTAATTNGFQYFDFYAVSQDLIANGRDIGGIHVSTAFVTGGIFAYGDPIHMSNIGYSILADELIQFINSAYGTAVPRPDLSVALFTPDVPAPGTTGIGATVDASLFFDEDSWRAFFDEFPLQDASLKLAFPADTEIPDRAPIILPGRRARHE
jgi:hypothetical protein